MLNLTKHCLNTDFSNKTIDGNNLRTPGTNRAPSNLRFITVRKKRYNIELFIQQQER